MFKIVHLKPVDRGYESCDTDYEPMPLKEAVELCMDLIQDAIDSKLLDRWIVIEI